MEVNYADTFFFVRIMLAPFYTIMRQVLELSYMQGSTN